MSRHLLCFAVLFAALAFGPRLSATEPDKTETVALWFKADITIAADGMVSALEWRNEDKIPVAVVDKLGALVHGWQFQPGTIDGQPTETETTLTLRLDARKLGDGSIGLTLGSATTGAAAMSRMPPEYPRTALRRGVSANITLDITVDVDGTVRVAIVDYAASNGSSRLREEFAESATAAVEQWDLEQERVGGHAVAAHMRYPISYCLNSAAWCESHPLATATDTAKATTPPGEPVSLDSVAKLLTDVRDTRI